MFLAIAISEQTIAIAVGAVFGGYSAAIIALWRALSSQEALYRELLERAVIVIQNQTHLMGEFRIVMERQTDALEDLATRISACAYIQPGP